MTGSLRSHRLTLLALAGFLVSATPVAATTIAFTDSASFLAALPGPASTLDFEGLASGTTLPSGSSEDGITFTYAIDGLSLLVTDSFDTTSGSNSLGLTGGDDALLDGDEITLSFDSSIKALGLFFITSDPALAEEIQLITSVGTALNSGTAEAILGDGVGRQFVSGRRALLPRDSVQFLARPLCWPGNSASSSSSSVV